MVLIAPYVYLLVKMCSFYFPRDAYDLSATLTTIPLVLQLYQLIMNQIMQARKETDTGVHQIDYIWSHVVCMKLSF